MDKVCVLMSTYNGEKYLREQIDSILAQKDVEIDLFVRDDGSTDDTINILEEYSQKGLLKYKKGKNLRPAKSFMELVYENDGYEYYAFADQDDYWKDKKIYSAVEKLKEYSTMALYISAVEVVDKDLNFISKSANDAKFTLAESFIQSPAIGCTMVFNSKMRDEIVKYDISNLEIGLHDSWIYRVNLAIGGILIYDTEPYIKYRQHENNVIGAKKTKTITSGLNELLKKRRKYKSEVVKNMIQFYSNEMTEKSKNTLDKILKLAENGSLRNKMEIIFDKEFKTNNRNTNLKFYYDVLKDRI